MEYLKPKINLFDDCEQFLSAVYDSLINENEVIHVVKHIATLENLMNTDN